MLWLTGIGGLAIGICLGILAAGKLRNASPSRIAALEEQLAQLQSHHERYRENVSQHFGMTAELVQQMTESYRDVYQHLASGAQELCSGEVANKLLPAGGDAVFGNSEGSSEGSALQAPRDYAPRQNPLQVGALSEEFGLEKKQDAEV
jgi:uncharacterized protein